MAIDKPASRKSDDKLRAFVEDVTATLLEGKRYQVPGLGAFSTCTRKATAGRAACKMAMFRASTELREYANGGASPPVSGPHSLAVRVLVEAMQSETGIDVPLLGRLAVVPVAGKKPKLIFHGATALNEALADS